MLEELRRQVYEANMQLQEYGLIKFTWGNVSGIDRDQGLVVIKPSGVAYKDLSPENMVIVDTDGNVVEGDMSPSTDTPTHIALYKAFDNIGGVVHTHSMYATIWAQAGLDITAYGTTHADYFYGDIPCTNTMRPDQIEEDYELQTGYHISDTFANRGLDYEKIPACLVASHGPFVWGKNPAKAVETAVVLEEVAHMALFTKGFEFGLPRIQDELLDKHYLRKHGENAYYGQREKEEEIREDLSLAEPDIEIEPSKFTTELKNIADFTETNHDPDIVQHLPKIEPPEPPEIPPVTPPVIKPQAAAPASAPDSGTDPDAVSAAASPAPAPDPAADLASLVTPSLTAPAAAVPEKKPEEDVSKLLDFTF